MQIPTGQRKPNIIVIMTDDQGYGDLSCHGNPIIHTPAMDNLAQQSVRLENFHVDPTCSPTRAALLTGCYSHRVNVWHTVMGRNHLERSVPTMADHLRAGGYRTAHFGKWHLGGEAPYRPIDRGFEEWLGQGDGGTGTMTDYWGNDRVNDVYLRNGKREQISGFAPDVFFEAAMDYIEHRRHEPFFVYLATYIPHTPNSLPDQHWCDEYRGKVPLDVAYFYASIQRADYNLGRLRAKLADLGLADDTILLFLTDNGTSVGHRVFNAGMKGQKGSLTEGGHRVPCLISWPRANIGHGRQVEELTAHVDLLPTLLDLCHVQALPGTQDGISLRALLEGGTERLPSRSLVVESQRILHPEKYRNYCVMEGNWRWLDGKELFSIERDPGQEQDIAADHPDVCARLNLAYEQYWASVTEGDESWPRPIIGGTEDGTVVFCGENMGTRSGELIFHQWHVANATPAWGTWTAEVLRTGKYRFDLRRWPVEVNLPINGEYQFPKHCGAVLLDEPIDDTLYRAEAQGTLVQSIPAASIQLKIAEHTYEHALDADDTGATFEVELAEGLLEFEAYFLASDGENLGSVYYAYVTPVTPEP